MSLVFYFSPFSTASITEAVLAELGIACERVQLDIQAGATREAAYLAVNPNGRVPAIVHDGTAIWESAAITMYLGEVFGVAAHLYPAPGPRRGEAMKWIVWSSVTHAEAGARLSASSPEGSEGAVEPGSRDWVPPEQRSAGALERAKADLATSLGLLDGALEGKPFLLGEYSLTDTHLQVLVGLFDAMGIDLTAYSNVVGWMRRCAERPRLAELTAP